MHQSIGDEVSIQEPNSLLCNEWIRIAVCVVFCSHPHHQILKEGSLACWLIVNGKQMLDAPGTLNIVPLSDHTWLLYFNPQIYDLGGMLYWTLKFSIPIGVSTKLANLPI